jgi:hypothetical protein
MQVHYELASSFAFAYLATPPLNRIPAQDIQDAFSHAYGAAGAVFWDTWKGNWGFKSVPDTWGNTEDIWYPADKPWMPQVFAALAYYPPPEGIPDCCLLAVGMGHG